MGHFGTDGIRKKAVEFTEGYLRAIAYGIAYLPRKSGKIIIGRDPRVSGDYMERVLSRVLCDDGIDVILAGVIPTPCLSYLTKFHNCDYGIMLSASHNPPEYNGVKLFSSEGKKVSDEIEKRVEENIDRGIAVLRLLNGTVTTVDNADDYIEYILNAVKPDLKGMKIALDLSNGATALIAPEIFRRAGAEVSAFFTETDGKNINCGCGATVPENLLNLMQGKDFDIGFTFDGDGDRVMCVSDGKIFNGDHLMYVHCKDMKDNGTLVDNVMVGTVMSNLGTEKACKNAGIKLVRTAVGDKNVSREMEKYGYNVGGEESGHLIFSDVMPTGDGILAALLTAKLHKKSNIAYLDDIVECPSVSDCIICGEEEKAKFERDAEIKKYLNNIGDGYRTVIRPSGTEPKIRILVESADEASAKIKAEEIKKFIRERIL